jgi:hypothetical protein
VGFKTRDCIEQIQRYACKRYACLNEKTPNSVTLGDCGRYPLFINAQIRCLKFWLKLLKMPDSRYVRKCYDYLVDTKVHLAVNWATEIKRLLHENVFGYVWNNGHVPHLSTFLNKFTIRLRDQYIQSWRETINHSPKLSVYKHIKSSYSHERYLDILCIRKYRHCYSQFRSGYHELEIEKGRYSNIPIHERICKVCNSKQVETEYHFVFICPMFKDLRARFIPRKFLINPNVMKLHILMSSRNETYIKDLASYIYLAFVRRKELLTL